MRVVTRMAGLLYTAVCPPKTMNFPGADTINVGAISDKAFLSIALNYIVETIGRGWTTS
jgi:hypothetical protein